MIKSALVAMVVIGCDSGGTVCQFIKETPPQWASVAECEAEMKHQMLIAGNFDYPTVSGLCRAIENGPPQVAAVSTAPASAPQAEAEAAVYAGLVEGGRSILYRTADGYTVVRKTLGRAAAGTADMARRTGGRILDTLDQTF